MQSPAVTQVVLSLASGVVIAALCVSTDILASHMHAWSTAQGKHVAAVLDTGLHGVLGAATWAAIEVLGHRLPGMSVSIVPPRSCIFFAARPVLSSEAVSAPASHALSSCLGSDGGALMALVDAVRSRAALQPWHADAVLSIVVCGTAAALLDVDHFVAAASLRMRDAMSLSARPFGHAVSFVVLCVALLKALRPASDAWVLLAVAWGTHHLRDAVKRGLWLAPFGHTPRVPYAAYVAAMALLPLATHLMLSGAFVAAGQRVHAAGSATTAADAPAAAAEAAVAAEP